MPRPVNWYTDFCLPLAGYGSTTITNPNPDLNRPALPALCEWVRQGWSGLDAGLGVYPGAVPEGHLMDRPESPDAQDYLSSWSPRYPFAGPTEWEWGVRAGIPWLGNLFNIPPPSVGNTPGIDIFESFNSDGTFWVQLDDQEVYILVREPRPSRDAQIPSPPFTDLERPRLGFSPIDAAAIGMAWKMMREALANLQPWWNAIVSSAAGTPDVPLGTPVPDVLAGADSVVSALVSRAQGLTTVQPRVFLWEDPYFDDGLASSLADSWGIRFRAGGAKGSTAPLHRLAATGLTNWAFYEHPRFMFPPYPQVTASLMKEAADHLAVLASILAHELMHQTWRRDLTYSGSWDTERYPKWWGPRMDAAPPPGSASALRTYRFEESGPSASPDANVQSGDQACRELPATVLQPPSGFPRAMDRATRHYAHYLVQAVVRGALMNSPGFALDRQDYHWCRDERLYAAFHGCGASTPVVQHPYEPWLWTPGMEPGP
jgi:hypothetical protein